MTWVLPGPITSDHPGVPFGYCGPTWVASVINAIGNSPDWSSTAIFVFWDDWERFLRLQPAGTEVHAGALPGFTACKSFQGSAARLRGAPEPRWLRLVGADRD
jgi:phospholipase C